MWIIFTCAVPCNGMYMLPRRLVLLKLPPGLIQATSAADSAKCVGYKGDACSGGACQPGASKSCSATGECKQNARCDPDQGGACVEDNKTDGTACSDGTCQSGVCTPAPTPGVCVQPSNVCQVNVSDAGVCTIRNQDGPCDDGNACTIGKGFSRPAQGSTSSLTVFA